jgi:hypothetical protein
MKIGTPTTISITKKIIRNAPPPLSKTRYGNRHIFPKPYRQKKIIIIFRLYFTIVCTDLPTAYPTTVKINSKELPKPTRFKKIIKMDLFFYYLNFFYLLNLFNHFLFFEKLFCNKKKKKKNFLIQQMFKGIFF